MKTIEDIAGEIQQLEEKIILIYAFNGTGKTRLSVNYKEITRDEQNRHQTGIYYNAFSEDLFVWDNDIDNGEQDIKLEIKPSSLNSLHQNLTEDDVRKKLESYSVKYNFKFTAYDDVEKGFKHISFYENEETEQSIKISRGEERIFVFCFFLALFEIEGWSDKQNKHFFIDDPVSSLDDQNIYITANIIFELIKKEYQNRKIIITSHHFGFLSILSNMLGKGEDADLFKNGKQKKYKEFVIEKNDTSLELIPAKKGTFLYHIRLLQILKQANDNNELSIYHFGLLRQVLESISSFLGIGRFSYVLEQLENVDESKVSLVINSLSHFNIYSPKIDIPSQNQRKILSEVIEKLINKYKFKI